MPAALPPATPPAQPGGGTAGSAGGPSFAQFLNDQPTLPTPPAHTDPVPREADSAPAPKASSAPAPGRPQAQAAPPAPPKDKPAPAKAEAADAPKDTATKETDDGVQARGKEDSDDPETAGLDEFTQLVGLATLTQATPGTTLPIEKPAAEPAGQVGRAARLGRTLGEAATEPAEVGRQDSDTSTDTGAKATSARDQRSTADLPGRAADVRQAKAGLEAAADKAAAATSRHAEAAPSLQASAQTHAAPARVVEGGTPNFAALMSQALPATGVSGQPSPALGSGQVHAALHSRAFAPELAASVSLLAVDGVQQAELQLNPAHMGPVAVQIVVDGAQAQVSFHAAQAETRQALEQSLPDLAAALQGQGLTLSGGGVFQQASRDAQDGDASSDREESRGSRTSGVTARADAGQAAARAPRRSVGLLDTFA